MLRPVSAETLAAFLRRSSNSVGAVGFVVDLDHAIQSHAEVAQDFFADSALVFELRMAGVDHVQHEIGGDRFFHRRTERRDEMVRQFADEADGVDDDRLARHVEGGFRRFGVERGEEFVGRVGGAAGEAIEERRLARVRVADQRDA